MIVYVKAKQELARIKVVSIKSKMSTTPTGGYEFFQKLHPLSLLAQLTSRRVTGCLSVFTDTKSWSIYLEEGKLTYASCSDKLFDRLDSYLQHLNQTIPSLDSTTRMQLRLIFEAEQETKLKATADYRAICWLVDRDRITPQQAATLIEELAKEVMQSFLSLKEGGYEFRSQTLLDKLPKFCHLDLRLIVEHCQKELRSQKSITIPASEKQSLPKVPVVKQNRVDLTQSRAQIKQKLPSANNIQENIKSKEQSVKEQDIDDSNHPKLLKKNLYTIACIDDSVTVLNSIKHFLDRNTFSVVTINDPVKALMQILRSKPDLILLDVEMPNLDGYELCSLLRKHSRFKDLPIIMVTGRTGFIDRAKAKMVRSSGYLTKPFTQSELLKAIFKHIS